MNFNSLQGLIIDKSVAVIIIAVCFMFLGYLGGSGAFANTPASNIISLGEDALSEFWAFFLTIGFVSFVIGILALIKHIQEYCQNQNDIIG